MTRGIHGDRSGGAGIVAALAVLLAAQLLPGAGGAAPVDTAAVGPAPPAGTAAAGSFPGAGKPATAGRDSAGLMSPADSANVGPEDPALQGRANRSRCNPDPSIAWGRRRRESAHEFDIRGYYQRVDGACFGVQHAFSDPGRPLPRFITEAGYASARKRWLYQVRVEQPLFPGERLVVGGGFHRLTRSFAFDSEIVGGTENTLAALLVREDYREYFEGEGGHLSARLHATGKYALSGEYRAEAQRPLSPIASWAVLDGRRFRDNPAIDAGTLRSVTATLSHDSRPRVIEEGVPFMREMRRANRDWVRLSYETAGRSLGGDFDYALARLDARGYWKLSPEQFLSARLLAGKSLRGRQPIQAEFYAGGISTLRAHPFKEFTGDRLLLVNAEYAVDVLRAMQALVFTDLGRAWVHTEHPAGPRLPIDVGFGLQTRDERLRVMIAKDARDAASPLFLTIRTQASF